MEYGGRPDRRRVVRRAVLCLAVFVPVVLAGCGGSLAPVSGTVKYKGASVKGGTLTFSPVGGTDQAGKPATAEVQQDGSYTLGTNSAGDGACVGRHRITYTPPSVELTDQQRTDPKYIAPQPPYAGLEPKQVEVEVKSGPNTIAIELVPARRK